MWASVGTCDQRCYIDVYEWKVCEIVCGGTQISSFMPDYLMCNCVRSTASVHPWIFNVVVMSVKTEKGVC